MNNLILRRRMMMAQGGVSLPDGYTALEYLESSGSNYIDTGFKPNQDSRIVMDWQMINATDLATLYCAFGCRGGGIYSALYKASKNRWNLTYYYGTTFTQEFTIDYSARHLSDYDKNSCTIDGVTLTYTAQTWQSAYSWFLCADNKAGSAAGAVAMRIYSCQIYDNGTLVRDYYPAEDSSGTKGLYDVVNDVFYPLQKEKVENKISIFSTVETNLANVEEVVFHIKASHPVASNIMITLEYFEYAYNDYYLGLFELSKGMDMSEEVCRYTYLEKVDQYIGERINSITSISPTEDDTYIYTF